MQTSFAAAMAIVLALPLAYAVSPLVLAPNAVYRSPAWRTAVVGAPLAALIFAVLMSSPSLQHALLEVLQGPTTPPACVSTGSC